MPPFKTEEDKRFQRLVGQRIRDARSDAGLTQQELVARVNANRTDPNASTLAPSNFSRIENGHVDLSINTLRQIERALGVAPGSLYADAQLANDYPALFSVLKPK